MTAWGSGFSAADAGQTLETWGAASPSGPPLHDILIDFACNRFTVGSYGLIAQMDVMATITLTLVRLSTESRHVGRKRRCTSP